MRISDWSSDVCSSDLVALADHTFFQQVAQSEYGLDLVADHLADRYAGPGGDDLRHRIAVDHRVDHRHAALHPCQFRARGIDRDGGVGALWRVLGQCVEGIEFFVQLRDQGRSEEPTSELQSLMRISYAV